jgi:phosphate starvation-inducible protein PhoH
MSYKKPKKDRNDSIEFVHEQENGADNSPYVFQREKINFDLSIKELPWTEKQKEIINNFLDKKTKVLLLKGPAGTSKTILSMYCGLILLNKRRVSDLVLVRSAVESSDSKLVIDGNKVKGPVGQYTITVFKDGDLIYLPIQTDILRLL